MQPDLSPADVLTIAGASVVVTLLVFVILTAWAPPAATRQRFGPLLSLLIGVIVVEFFSLATGGDVVQGLLTGLLAGAAAMGIQNVATQTVAPAISPPT